MIADRRQVCVVTGGSSGIGRAISIALAQRGCSVIVVGRTPARIDETLAAMAQAQPTGAGADHAGFALDVSSPAEMNRLSEVCASRYGRVDALIASAGIGRASETLSRLPRPTTQLTISEWQSVIDVNLHGIYLSNMAVLPLMLAQGSGDILNVCSSTTPRGLRGRPMAQAYSASKFAVAAYTEALANEVEDSGVRVSAVFPGPVKTSLIESTALHGPFGGWIEAEDFAQQILGLLDLQPELRGAQPHILPMPRSRAAGRRVERSV
jgi:3-oxoacyl-[acyl-carrier protein] reductase